MKLRACLLAFVSVSCVGHALAETASMTPQKKHKAGNIRPSRTKSATSAAGATPSPLTKKQESAKTASTDESLMVMGHGSSRQSQTMSRKALQQYVPGTSPLMALSKLPGVAYESADPFGNYEYAQQITVRGFSTGYLGYTLDEVPLGNLQYGNDNGLSINRAIISENNGPATLAQGTGALATASTSNLGGTFLFTSADPDKKFGADLAETFGSFDFSRTFARINTGTLPGGGRAYASFAYTDGDKWKGSGPQTQYQANVKYVQPLGNHVRATIYADWSDHRETGNQDLSYSIIKRLGYNVDNISNNWALAKQIATAYQTGHAIPSPYTSVNDVYYDVGALREDVLGYGRLDYDILPKLRGHTIVYGHEDSGQGLWTSPVVPTPSEYDGGGPISLRTTEYDIHREGVITDLTYEFGQSNRLSHNTINSGFWFENNNFENARRFYPLGENAPDPFLKHYTNPFATQWQDTFNTKTYQYYIQDTWNPIRGLKLNFGFKTVSVNDNGRTVSGSPVVDGRISATRGFLPQAGIVYDIDRSNEIFAGYAENMRSFEASAFTGVFSTTQSGFNAIKNTLKPETSRTEEVGYRFRHSNLQASVTGYYVQFDNRLLQTTVGASIVGAPSALSNVGSVTSRGVEATANWRIYGPWSLYASWAYNDSHYDNNVYGAGGALVVATAGKQTVATPRNIGSFQISYDDGQLWGNLIAQYQSQRFYTYDNTNPIPGYWVLNANLGWRFQNKSGPLHGAEIQLNLGNITDTHYISTVGSTGFVNSDPKGTADALLTGTPPFAYASFRKHF
ncbi:TonB-dependent receptor [Acetobacter persici]|uniref:TonB-dependent receptor n=1 Tax=Acetobacter persici TaxID=1076596 RepID=UPI0036DA024C